MTAADLITHCKTFEAEHGVLVLFDVLEAVFQEAEQAAGVDLSDMDEDGRQRRGVRHGAVGNSYREMRSVHRADKK